MFSRNETMRSGFWASACGAVLALCAFLPYARSLTHSLVSDDLVLITHNPLVQQPSRVVEVLGFDDGIPDARSFRTLTLILDRAVGGGKPFAFHLSNVLFHAIVTVLVFVCGLRFGLPLFGAFSGALFFAVHPAFGEAVWFVTARKDELATLFSLVAFLFYLGYRERRGVLRGGMVLCAVGLAMLAKEVAVVVPALFILFERPSSLSGLADLLRRFRGLFGALAVAAVLMTWVAVFDHRISARLAPGGEGIYGDLGGHLALCFTVLGKYLSLLAFPVQLSADYSFGVLEVTRVSAVLGVFLVGGGIALALVLSRAGRVEGFFAAWVLVSLLPVAQLVPHHELLSEHNLYLPGVGACLLFGSALSSLRHRVPRSVILATLGLVLVLGARTVLRGADWKDMNALVRSVLRDHPECGRAHYNAGELAYVNGRLVDALAEFEVAARIARAAPSGHCRVLPSALNQIGLIRFGLWSRAGRRPEDPNLGIALESLREAMGGKRNSDLPSALNFATAALAAGLPTEACESLEAIVRRAVDGFGERPWDERLQRAASLYLVAWHRGLPPGRRRGEGGGALLPVRAAALLIDRDRGGLVTRRFTGDEQAGRPKRSQLEELFFVALLAADQPELALVVQRELRREELGTLASLRRLVLRKYSSIANARRFSAEVEENRGLVVGRTLPECAGSEEDTRDCLSVIGAEVVRALLEGRETGRSFGFAVASRWLGLRREGSGSGPSPVPR